MWWAAAAGLGALVIAVSPVMEGGGRAPDPPPASSTAGLPPGAPNPTLPTADVQASAPIGPLRPTQLAALMARSRPAPAPPPDPSGAARAQLSTLSALAKGAAPLPPATTKAHPAPPSLAGSPPLHPHEVFGFAPYWTLGQSSGFDLAGLSTLAYFGVDVTGDGSISHAGPGWAGLHSQALVDLVDRAHQAGDRVVLTVECFDQATLDRLTHDPSAPARLAHDIAAAISSEPLDGVNFDFEGTGAGDRQGLVATIGQVSRLLKSADPHWQVTVDTYGGSASDPAGFFDVAGLAPYVDAFFVMAYDMGSRSTPSPNAPLSGSGWTDADVVASYTSVVPASKVVLGIPFYGYEWATAGDALGAAAISGGVPVTYATLAGAGHPSYWDAAASSPWTAWRSGGSWHQALYDGPTSVALKAALADQAGLRGVGVWALGMAGGDPSMMAALLGQAPAAKDWSPSPEPTPAALGLVGSGSGAAPPTGSPAP
ncbi:MAG: glycosyl hydrolase family 18 protein, partial [Acidimicrobiales bacterium]